MMFTQEQIDEIEQKLAKRGAKDTQLPSAKTPLTGDESIAIVQERENRLVPVGSIVNTDGGIFNVSEYLKVKTEVETSVILTLSEAIEACPSRVKKAGQIITFIDKDKEWQRYQYQGYNVENWNQLTLWKDLNNVSEDMPVSEDVMSFNITEYMPGGSKSTQAIWAGIYTIDGITPVSQYRVIFGCDASLGIVEGIDMETADTLAIIDIDTDEVAVFRYILFVGNSIDGYRYQTTINSDEDVPDWIAKAFGNNSSYIAANIESLERRVNTRLNNKVDKIQGKGLSTNDFTDANVSELANSIVNAIYNSNTKRIVFTKNNSETIELDATPFIKDGMVNSVSIVDGYLVITFNTDSGKETIRISLTDIFDPDDYYTKTQTDGLLGNKVDKEQGKGLSSNDYTDDDKNKLGDLPTNSELEILLGGKVNKIEGKGLSANDYTTAEKNKLSDLPTASELTQTLDDKASKESLEEVIKKAYMDANNSEIITDSDNMQHFILSGTGTLADSGLYTTSRYAYIDTNTRIIGGVSYEKTLQLSGFSTYPTFYIHCPFGGQLFISILTDDYARFTIVGHHINESCESSYVGTFEADAGEDIAITHSGSEKRIWVGEIKLTYKDYLERTTTITLLNSKVDKITGKGLSTNDYSDTDKDKLTALPTASELSQQLGSKANTADLATVATSGNYNDLSGKPTLDDLNKDLELYSLDGSNSDYMAAANALISQGIEIPISHDIEGAKLRVYKKTSDDIETGNTSITLIEPSVNEITYSDGTTFTAYQRGSARYIGLKWNFFDNYGSYTNGNIEVTCEVAGVLKLYFLNCGMHEDAYFKKNGQTTNVKLKNGVLSFDVEAGDVLTVSPTYIGYQYVGLVGMSITSRYHISKFINDADFITNSVDNLVNYYLKSETYTKTEVQQLIGAIRQFHYEVYPTLPQTGANNVLYLIGPTGTGADKYEEYVYSNNDWTKIGDTSIDLSGYVTTQALNTALADYVTSSALSTALAGKEDIIHIEAVASGITAINAAVNTYYEVSGEVGTLSITLPTPTDLTKVSMVVVHLTAGTNPNVVIGSAETIDYSAAYDISASKEYEINCMYNGDKWVVADMEVV